MKQSECSIWFLLGFEYFDADFALMKVLDLKM